MRILKLRFKNLNSLLGEWSIDFTCPEIMNNGIFAIIGPTGAGKTTILDAICLALYAQTPRLGKITKSSNEIMSQRTGECFSEVEFETHKGRFLCHWNQHRAHKKADGDLQNPRHEISDLDTGKILETRLKYVVQRVESLTGMDFYRFTRAMLLAQGDFAAFLQAKPDERAPILEQITGTEIYSQLSIIVHERRTEEYRRLEDLREGLKFLHLLSDKELLGLEKDLESYNLKVSKVKSEIDRLSSALLWLNTLDSLEKDLKELDHKQEMINREFERIQPDLKKLELAQKALNLGESYARLVALREQKGDCVSELDALTRELPAKTDAFEMAKSQLTDAESRFNKLSEIYKIELKLINRVKALDVRIQEKAKIVDDLKGVIEENRRSECSLSNKLGEIKDRIADLSVIIKKLELFLSENSKYETLSNKLAGIEQQIITLKRDGDRLAQIDIDISRYQHELDSLQRQVAELSDKRTGCDNRVRELEGEIARLDLKVKELLHGKDLIVFRDEIAGDAEKLRSLKEIETVFHRIDRGRLELKQLEGRKNEYLGRHSELLSKKSGLIEIKSAQEQLVTELREKLILLNRVRSLEEERRLLEDGKPCPLCGSLDHPYAQGNIPAIDSSQEKLERAQDKLDRQTRELSDLDIQIARSGKDLDQIEDSINRVRDQLNADQGLLQKLLNAIGLPETVESDDIHEMLVSAKRELELKQELFQRAQETDSSKQELLKALDLASGELKALDISLFEIRQDELKLSQKCLGLVERRKSVNEDIASVIGELNKQIAIYDVGLIDVNSADDVLMRLTEKRDLWEQRKKGLEDSRRDCDELLNEQKTLQIKLQELTNNLTRECERLKSEQQNLDSLITERKELYGNKDPEHEEQSISDRLNRASNELEAARRLYNKTDKELDEVKNRIRNLEDRSAHLDVSLEHLSRDFSNLLSKEGFSCEQDFKDSRISREEFKRLLRKKDEFFKRESEIKSAFKDKNEQLEREKDKNITDDSVEDIETRLKLADEELQELQQEIGSIKQSLDADRKRREEHKRHLEHIAAQQKEFVRWDRLHSLIGSADGKKFRNFAQGLTFECMIAYANRQLKKMTDRYLLLRDKKSPLTLNVLDNYQAGEIRSTKNLSGGESFIVSLALALGLSQMSSKNVRVDSLFLDEGFGTLDEKALDTALDTLVSLQQEGKFIGIISHVAVLRERIATQIKVIPEIGGKSYIKGPGCTGPDYG